MTMGTTRRTYSSEFKSEAVELAASSGRSMAEVERELGLPVGLLKQWVRKAKRDGEAAFPGHGRLKATEFEQRFDHLRYAVADRYLTFPPSKRVNITPAS